MPAQQQRPKPKHPPYVTLRALREAYGISREDLLDRLAEHGYIAKNTNMIRAVETGWQKPGTELITAWAKALRLNPADVILPSNGDAA